MKRLHIHIAVDELADSINFYSTIFGAAPNIEHKDYAKWTIDDPAVNFAISNRGQTAGINHLGIQVDSESELKEISQRLEEAEITSSKQEGASCCYANSNKHWALDPQGIAWESFHTLADIPTFSQGNKEHEQTESSACCIPLMNNEMADPAQDEAACCIPNENDSSACCK